MTVNANESNPSKFGVLQILGFITKVLIPVYLIVITMYYGRAMGTAIYQTYFELPDERKVPKIVGQDVKQAEALLKKFNLMIDVSEEKFSATAKKDEVMEQMPQPGRDTREGGTVSVVVSLGPDMVEAPDVVGKSVNDALVALHNAKLNIGKITRVTRDKATPEGVLEQNPKAGASVKKGAKVNLLVNMGNETRVKVPTFANDTIERVRDAANLANLNLGTINWVLHDGIDAGTVINQDPPANKEVHPGTEVNVHVSMGSPYDPQDVRQRQVTVRAQDIDGPQNTRVVVTDLTGTYTAYEGTHFRGDVFTLYVTAIGRGEYEIYANDKLVMRAKI